MPRVCTCDRRPLRTCPICSGSGTSCAPPVGVRPATRCTSRSTTSGSGCTTPSTTRPVGSLSRRTATRSTAWPFSPAPHWARCHRSARRSSTTSSSPAVTAVTESGTPSSPPARRTPTRSVPSTCSSAFPPTLREPNRFYARLGFSPVVVRRMAPVGVLRRRLADGGHPVAALEELTRRRLIARPRLTRSRRRFPVGGPTS